jgi:hypothetical protein
MFCTHCGAPIDPSSRSCPACGASVNPLADAAALPSAPPMSDSTLTSASRLVMVYQGGLMSLVNFGFEDASGKPLGATRGEVVFPLKYTLYDEHQQPVLILDGVRVRGLLYDFLVHDPSGGVLASIRQESSFMSRKYGVSVNGEQRMTLTTDAIGYHYQLTENGSGVALATGSRTSGLHKSYVQLEFSDDHAWDHRIGIGAMLLVYYLCTRRTG